MVRVDIGIEEQKGDQNLEEQKSAEWKFILYL